MGCCNTKIDEKTLCYCFNISENAYLEALKTGKGAVLKDFVVFQTKYNYCNCENLNPSKQCCLKEFKKLEISVKNQIEGQVPSFIQISESFSKNSADF